jgi:hypothetical protein
MAGSALDDLASKLQPFLTGTDAAAIHDDTAEEIGDVTAKAAPAIDDVFLLEDASDAEAKKSTTLGAMLRAAGQLTNLDAATPLRTDKIAFEDQSDADAMKVATIQEALEAAGWIAALTAKATPLSADMLAVGDTAASDAIKRSTILQVTGAAGLVSGLTSKATPTGSDLIRIDDAAASNAAKKVTIDSLPIAQSQVAGLLVAPAADAAAAILTTTRAMRLTVTGAGNVAISTTSSHSGQLIHIFAVAVAGGGSYTLALDSGTLTLNATGESAVVMRDGSNWVCVGLSGATIV